MEEVLYHPLIFKTTKCEEYANLTKDSDKKKTTKHGKKRCHRYYCPFAHGDHELRTSTLSESDIQKCLSKLSIFPSSDCCKFCVLACRSCNLGNTTSTQLYPPIAKREAFPRLQEDVILSPILATAPQPYSNLLALRQAREQASLKEELANLNLNFSLSLSPLLNPMLNPLAFGAAGSPTSSPLSKATSEYFEETHDLNDLPPPLKIHVDGFGAASLAPIYHTSQKFAQLKDVGNVPTTQNFTQQKDFCDMKDELSARIYAML
jgi:hypothetical protein